jgi:DNA-binding transcriptional LysR family regulator
LKVQVGNTQAMSRALIDCEIDIALVEGVVNDPRIVASHWRNDELTIIAPRNLTVSRARQPNLKVLKDQVWLLRETGSGTREATERVMRDLGIAPRRSTEIGSNEGIARAVAAGSGIAMLPTQVVRELVMLNEVKAVHLREKSNFERPLFLLQLKERPSSPLVHAFCELLQQAQGKIRSSIKDLRG